MAQALDPRIVRIGVQVNGNLKVFESPLGMIANGTKYANALQNEAEITIFNMDRATQDYILTETSPFNTNRTPKVLTVEAGRVSAGTAKIYQGNIITSGLSQPPDTGVILKCLTGNFVKGNVLAVSRPGQISLEQVSKQLASDIGATLKFQTTDRLLTNFSYSGSSLKQIDQLNNVGGLNVYINDDVLIVKDAGAPVDINGTLRIISAETGMIGIPEFTEHGVRVKFFIDTQTTLGGAIQIISRQYPATNGVYVIYKLGFEIATRDVPFYYVAEAARRTQ